MGLQIFLYQGLAGLSIAKELDLIQMIKVFFCNGPRAGVMQRKFWMMLATLILRNILFA